MYFSTIDLKAAYWQIPIHENDKPKTAFICQEGLFEYNSMPFGLANAPSKFQSVMDSVLAGVKWHSALVYLDDIIIFSKTLDAHFNDIQAVFDRLRVPQI